MEVRAMKGLSSHDPRLHSSQWRPVSPPRWVSPPVEPTDNTVAYNSPDTQFRAQLRQEALDRPAVRPRRLMSKARARVKSKHDKVAEASSEPSSVNTKLRSQENPSTKPTWHRGHGFSGTAFRRGETGGSVLATGGKDTSESPIEEISET